MFKKIVRYIANLRGVRSRSENLEQQIELGQRLRDMLGVARKLNLDVVMTIEVGNQRQGVLLPGDGPVGVWLYNFACGEILAKQARLEKLTIFDDPFDRTGFTPVEKGGATIVSEGP